MLDENSRNWIAKNMSLFSPEVKQQALGRLAVCKDCPELRPKLNTCKQCGCLMPAKVFLKKAQCPIHKWGQMEGV